MTKELTKSRFFYLDPRVNQGKIDRLEALQVEYTKYLRECVNLLIETRTYRLPKLQSQMQEFFPRATNLISQIEKNARGHAIGIVNGWAKAIYVTKMRRLITNLKKDKEITEAEAKALYTVGKYFVHQPSNSVSQESIDHYWKLLDKHGGRKPTVPENSPMRLSQNTAKLEDPDQATEADFWITISTLAYRKLLALPLVGNPYVSKSDQVTHGILARKTKDGRWRFEAVDKKEWFVRDPDPGERKIGVDVGLNVIAASSNGDLYGEDFKPKYDRFYFKVKKIRANRKRQGFDKDSKRLNRLESRLSGMIKTETGRVANVLVKRFPDTTFVVEDLALRGSPGSKRFAYKALITSLESKAPIIKVNPAYTSCTCPSCGYVSKANRSGTKFVCTCCGRVSHADWVGSVNILGRSEDKSIDTDDRPFIVEKVLKERYRLRRNSSSGSLVPGVAFAPVRRTRAKARHKIEPLPLGQDLTVVSTQVLLGSRIDPNPKQDQR